ncbi:uncharacterized protein LOC107866531 isoform X2 [Capsicum annuum]|uniref:uncharacterized protein LOC107866531 isoform X2 n=1 Tax=Capsicum annuum TaxID=4072 RepID=UPI0007BFC3F9|nr:uncharacterized protein LOC107866531 isoform X2 [Capsicum annuum]
MAFNANVLVIFSLVLVIISLEVIADPALPVVLNMNSGITNGVQNVVEMNNKTLQGRGIGGGGGWRPGKDSGGGPVKGGGGSGRDNKGPGKYKGEKSELLMCSFCSGCPDDEDERTVCQLLCCS